MKIRNFDTDKRVFVIAEIGNNHEGSYALAEELIGKAAQAGADAVKFQTIVPEKLFSVLQEGRIEQLSRFKLSFKQFEQLSKVAEKENILFLSTPFDIEGAKFLDTIVPAFKISSGDINFYPLLECVAQTGKPIIFSSGASSFAQVEKTKQFIESIWKKKGMKQDLAILHCVSRYPTSMEEANLLAIRELQKLNVTVGYSDHTLGIDAAVLSAALGARIIEKHFTIDKNHSDFRDHQLSADPKDLALLIERVHRASPFLGCIENCFIEEEKAIMAMRRSIVAARDLSEHDVLHMEDLDWVRPGGGIPPGEEGKIIGKKLKRSITMGEMIHPEDAQ